MNLLEAAVQIATQGVSGVGQVSDITSAPIPEYSGQVNLGKPGAKLVEARAVLKQREVDGLAELDADIESIEASIEAEREIVQSADVDAAKAIKAGTETRESLANKRAAASVSLELIADLDNQLADVKYRRQTERGRYASQTTRLLGWADRIAAATRAYQIDCVTGMDKLNAEKYGRQLSNLLSFRAEAERLLGEELAHELEAELTTHHVPSTLVECLFQNMPARDKEKYEEHNPNNSED